LKKPEPISSEFDFSSDHGDHPITRDHPIADTRKRSQQLPAIMIYAPSAAT